MALVAGVDSSTQSCKVVVCDAASGTVLRTGSAAHSVPVASFTVSRLRWAEVGA